MRQWRSRIPFLGSGLASVSLRLAGLASSFLLGVVLARTLGPVDYGVYGFVIATSALGLNIILFGTPQLAVRELAARSAAADWDGARDLVRSFTRFVAAAALVLGIATLAIVWIVGAADDSMLAIVGVFLTGALGITALVGAELRGLGQLFRGQFMDILGRPIAVFAIIGLILVVGRPLTALGALGVQLFVAIVAALVSVAWLRKALPRRQGQVAVVSHRAWLGMAIPLGIVDVLRTFDGTYGLLLMGWLASANDLGVFRVALAANVLASLPITAIHVVLAPRIAVLFANGDRAELQKLLRLVSAAMVLALVPALLILMVFGKALVQIVFGSAYADAAAALTVLCAGQLVFGLFGMGPILLAMADAERPLVRIYAAAVSIGVVLALVLVPLFGGTGAAVAQLASASCIGFLSDRHARRTYGVGTTFFGLWRREVSAPGA